MNFQYGHSIMRQVSVGISLIPKREVASDCCAQPCLFCPALPMSRRIPELTRTVLNANDGLL